MSEGSNAISLKVEFLKYVVRIFSLEGMDVDLAVSSYFHSYVSAVLFSEFLGAPLTS